jgi:hypothetical protein
MQQTADSSDELHKELGTPPASVPLRPSGEAAGKAEPGSSFAAQPTPAPAPAPPPAKKAPTAPSPAPAPAPAKQAPAPAPRKVALSGPGLDPDDPRVAKMQQKLNASMSMDNPNDMLAVLNEAEPIGDAVRIERDALQGKYDKLIGGAVSEMQGLLGGTDFQAMQAALDRYDGYPGDAQQTFQDLQVKWDEMLENTKVELRKLMSSRSPAEIDEKLSEIAAEYSDSIAEEKAALATRRTKLIRDAQSELSTLAADAQAPLDDMSALLTKYEKYPADVDTARRALKSELDRRINALTSEMTRLQTTDDFAAIDAAIAQDAKSMETHMPDVLAKVQAYREKLLSDMASKLQEACSFGAQNSAVLMLLPC